MSSSFDIAIVGMAGRFPGARTVAEFWRNLAGGVESISFFTDEEVVASGVDPSLVRDPHYVKAGGVLDDIDRFDAVFFGYSPREAEVMDPQQRVFLECAWEALEDAGYDTERYRRPVGVFAGMSMNTYVLSNLIYNPAAVEALGEAQAAIANLHDHLATRVSYKLDLRGPSFTVQTACSTSLVAVHLACQALISGECDMALAGGVSIGIPQKAGYLYVDGGTHSPDGHCRAFDADAKGMIGGSGVGTVVLKRLDDAMADGDRIVAVVKGTAVNNDGASKVGYTAPSVEGQARVVRAALRAAEVTPDTITYVEAHGTGTPIGDPIEIEALARVFRGRPDEAPRCGIGSVKTNVGHLDAAAGVAGLMKVALSLHHKRLPPSLHFTRPNPRIDFAAAPFSVVDRLREWPAAGGPRRAGVSAFGIGGTNAHAVLEEAPAAASVSEPDEPQVYVVSARTPAALEAARERLANHLESDPSSAPDVAWTLQVGRRAFPARSAFVARTSHEAVTLLRGGDASRVLSAVEPRAQATAFLFPGQGTQYPRMARELYARFPVFRDALDRCGRAMASELDVDLLSLLVDDTKGAPERLQQTQYAQPALFAVEYALAQLLTAAGVKPAALLGHSIGEYTAACLAGVFTLEDAAALVAMRGRLMSEAPRGAMLAVQIAEADARSLLNDQLSLAAVNGPSASVIAGTIDAIDVLERRAVRDGIACSRLRTSHAFHSHLMDGVVDRFERAVADRTRSAPATRFVSNVTGTWITAAEATDPRYWARHLREPVRFADGVRALISSCPRVIEVGPGQVLTMLARQAASSSAVTTLTTLPSSESARGADEVFLNAIARLWTEGVAIDWARLHEGRRRTRVSLPTYPFERQRHWVERAQDRPAGVTVRAHASAVQLYVPSWRRDPVRHVPDTSARTWLVLADAHGLGAAIASRLETAGQRVAFVDASEMPADVSGFEALLARLKAERRTPDAVVYCAAAAPVALRMELSSSAVRARAFSGLVALAQAMERQRLFTPLRFEVITADAHDALGVEPLNPAGAMTIGPLRVIPQESPNVQSRGIDVTWPDGTNVEQLADAVCAELLVSARDQIVALRNGHRWTLRHEHAQAEGAPVRDLAQGAAIVFGGSGTIGGAAARALVASGTHHIVLASRGGRAAEALVQELERGGAQVMDVACDVEDVAAVRSAFGEARRRFGRVTTVVHAAGVAGASAFTAIADMTDAHADAQLGPKLRAMRALSEVVGEESPSVVLVVSSLATVLGGLGFCAYASANALLDAYAASNNRRGGTRWVAIDWDGWRADGAQVSDAIDSARGRAAFEQLLRHDLGECVVAVAGDLEPRLARWINPGVREERAAPAMPAVRASGRAATPPANEVEQLIVNMWGELLGVGEIGVDDSFFDLGGHSLLATQLISRLRRTLMIDVPLRDVFDRPTVRQLAAAVVAHEPAPGQAIATARLRLKLGQMSPDDMRAMLAARRDSLEARSR